MKALIGIMRICRQQWPWMAAGVALGIAVIAANTLLMALAGWFIASMAVSGVAGLPFNYFLPSVMLRILAILRTIGRYGERLVTHEAAFRQLSDLRAWLFRRLAPLAPAGLERHSGGDIAGRLRGDVDALENLYLRIIAPLATGGISILLAVIWTACWSMPAAALLLLFLLITAVVLPLLAYRQAAGPGHRSTVLAGELRTCITEGIQGVEELTILGALDRQAAQVENISSRLIAEQQRLGGINALTQCSGFACSGLAAAALLLTGSLSVAGGLLTGPEMTMLLLFGVAAFEAAMSMPGALQSLPATSRAAGRILEIAGTTVPVPDPPVPVAELPRTAAIAFRDVCFSYVSGSPVLSGFNLEIPDGGSIALTGPSGCGKSTLAELLLRFRDFDGSITIGGIDIRHMAADDLHRLIAALPQKPHLFNSSIRENVLLAAPETTEERLRQALDDAGLTGWIETLPLGLDTPVGESGSAVSGGEARRIALARALLKDAPILLLDEPTEGLDARTERFVIQRLMERTAGKTVILITHRPACLKLADRIVALSINQNKNPLPQRTQSSQR